MTRRFENFIPFVLEHEGGTYENDPDDPGGATKWGIDSRSHPGIDIKNLTKAEAVQIYFDSYWEPSGCEGLPPGLGEAQMDASVNCGPSRADKFLAASGGDAAKYNDERDAFYYRLAEARPSMRKFLRGWLNRTKDLRAYIGDININKDEMLA